MAWKRTLDKFSDLEEAQLHNADIEMKHSYSPFLTRTAGMDCVAYRGAM